MVKVAVLLRTLLGPGIAACLALALAMPARPAFAPVARAAELPAAIPAVYLHLPKTTTSPVQVLVALHGMGGNGEAFASNVLAQAERNHWLIVAPTITYGDWTDPAQVAREEPTLIRWLGEYLDGLPNIVGMPINPRVLLLGHSRGAQLAHRFALFQPERVLAVAALSAGTYTLPFEQTLEGSPMRFPFGLSDMPTVAGYPFKRAQLIEDTQFWLGVGTEDNNPNDLPRAWDVYLGATRVQRAQRFQAAMHQLGARSVMVAFRGEHHALSPDMANSACAFLRGLDLAQTEPRPPSEALHRLGARPSL